MKVFLLVFIKPIEKIQNIVYDYFHVKIFLEGAFSEKSILQVIEAKFELNILQKRYLSLAELHGVEKVEEFIEHSIILLSRKHETEIDAEVKVFLQIKLIGGHEEIPQHFGYFC